MGNMTIAAVFVALINIFMFLAQATILELNPTGTQFYNSQGTFLETYDQNKGTGTPVLDTTQFTDDLPSAPGSISPTTGNLFTDTFTSIKTWFSTKANYIGEIVSAPYSMLKYAGAPEALRFAIGTLWYVITFIVIVSFFWGER